MSAEYFEKYPLVRYNGKQAVNLFARTTIREELKQNYTAYLPLTIQDGERPDMIAYDYYNDAMYSWLLYYANDIIDPYLDYPLSQHDLDEYIKMKYGSLEQAESTILFYQKRDDLGTIINAESLAGQVDAGNWHPVNAYNFEVYMNNIRSQCFIIRNDLAPIINNELETKLNE